MLAVELVVAAKIHDLQTISSVDKKWHDTAGDIAAFLHAPNPDSWPLAAMVANGVRTLGSYQEGAKRAC